MSISMFESRKMLAAMIEMPPARTFLRDTFFRNVKTFTEENVDIDIVKGKRRVAAYVSPLDAAHVVGRAGYETLTYKAPYIKEKMVTTAADLMNRAPGENVYGVSTPSQRAADQLAEDMMELDTMITRAEEIQASQALFAGEITVKDGAKITFPLEATHKLTLTSTDLWSDAGMKKEAIIAQFRAWRATIVKDSGLAPTDIIMGTDAVNQFIKVVATGTDTGLMSSFKLDRGMIDPKILPNGVIYWGYIKEVACDLWSYDEYYHDGSTDQPMVPTKKVLMISQNARMDRLYGVIKDLKALFAVPRFPKSWEEEDPSARFLMMQSAPLLVPHQINGFLFAQVLS